MESYKQELLFDQYQRLLVNKKTAPIRGYNSDGGFGYYNVIFLKDGKIRMCYYDSRNPEGCLNQIEFETNYESFKHVYLVLTGNQKFTEEEMNLPF